jgi:MFS transporter, YNFM family, putative membrane transport protein
MTSPSFPAPTPTREEPAQTGKLRAGTPEYHSAIRAMFFGGFATFAMLYGLQPLMPALSDYFSVTPASASAVMSLPTGCMALCLIPASQLSDRFGRKQVITVALAIATVLTLLCPFARDFHLLLALRTLSGIALAGLPAVALAYLTEEVEPDSLGRAVGLYIAGNALGGMLGRLASALIADWQSWQLAIGAMGLTGLLATNEFRRRLPASRHFQRGHISFTRILEEAREHIADAGLPSLFLTAFLLMGCFSSYYNYIGFRLRGPEIGISPALQGFIFTFYIFGIGASAWAGKLADQIGRRKVLWIMVLVTAAGLVLSLSTRISLLTAGVALVTSGFFGAHSVASSWVGRRAKSAKALASALYLSSFYLGSSLLGYATGLIWNFGGWPAIIALLGLMLALCFTIALRLRSLEPLPT